MSDISDSAYRLCLAIDMIEDSWNRSDGIRPDLDPEYEGIQAWLWVPNLYQLLEQSFKVLLQHKKQNTKKTHRLSNLYSLLDSSFRSILDRSFGDYCELYDYLSCDTLKSFLERADHGKGGGTGYTTWRYLLLEGFPSDENETPKVHIGAMLEISIATRDIMRARIISNRALGNEGSSIIPISVRIQQSLIKEYSDIAKKYCSRSDVRAAVLNKPDILKQIELERSKYCHDLLSRNLLWAYGYIKSSPCLELSPEHTKIMKTICERMKREHKHDFLQYIKRLRSGEIKPFELPSLR